MNAGPGQTGLPEAWAISLPSADPAEFRGECPSAEQSPSVVAPTGALARPGLSAERAP